MSAVSAVKVPVAGTLEDLVVEWAVRWHPSGPMFMTGSKPPWSADYAKWKRARDPVVYRRRIVTTTIVSVEEWEEATS